MKHDPKPFSAAIEAYRGDITDRVRRFLPMVKRLAWHVHGSGRPGIELEDLVQAGLVALTECAQKHAGPGEDGFAAYAKMRVRGAMVDLIRRTTHGKTLLLVEHDMDVVFGLADRVSVLAEGRIIATGTSDEIRANRAVRNAYPSGESAHA